MELHALQVFLTVANERSFSRAAEKLFRTQPAVSLAVQRLEQEFGEKLIDRSGKDLILTDAGRTVLDFARRFQSLQQELDNSLAELRDNSSGRLKSKVIYTASPAFVVSPSHRLAGKKSVAMTELAAETFIAHNVVSPYRDVVLREFQSHKVPLRMEVEMPTIE